MLGYAQTDVFSVRSIQAFTIATTAVERVNELVFAELLRCHELARATAAYLKHFGYTVRVVDGKFGSCDHSWIVVAGGSILDTYVPGSLPLVQLVDTDVSLLPKRYFEGKTRTDIRDDVVDELLRQMNWQTAKREES